ncbi:MAG: hypothetical protein JSW00_19520 [Thermoplasmata archaeon]|nr:MAG: hypothetical protein JSW00_19520 [Thermoplasmata archaeon]
MSLKKVAIWILLVVIILNIIQLNIFLYYIYDSPSPTEGIDHDLIPYIWYGEIILGIIIFASFFYYVVMGKKVTRASRFEEFGEQVKGDVKITPALGYNDVNFLFKVTVDNKTAFPLSDVMAKTYLSQDIFSIDEEKKSISVIRPYDSATIKFKLKSRRGESGEADVLGTVNYYNPGIDEYVEKVLNPKTIKIAWPQLKEQEIEAGEWQNVISTLESAEETVSSVPLTGEKCSDLVLDAIKDIAIYMVSSEVKDEKPYKSITRFYSLDKNNMKYALEFVVTAKGKNDAPSKLKFIVYTENKGALVGLYHLVFHELNLGLEKVKEERRKAAQKLKATSLRPVPGSPFGLFDTQRDIFIEYDRLRDQIETIEKDKIGVDSKFKSLYELDELYKILAEDLVKRKIVDIEAGEEIVKKRLDKKNLEELKRFSEAYALLCEAETSDSVLSRKDFPDSGKKAILLVYFNAVEVYIREKLKKLLPKGVTILLGENHGHINTRKKDWEKSWDVLSLGSCIHIINHNGYLFLKDPDLWKHKVETLMHQVREMRNTVAHPSKENPDPNLVRDKVYKLLKLLPEVLKTKED